MPGIDFKNSKFQSLLFTLSYHTLIRWLQLLVNYCIILWSNFLCCNKYFKEIELWLKTGLTLMLIHSMKILLGKSIRVLTNISKVMSKRSKYGTTTNDNILTDLLLIFQIIRPLFAESNAYWIAYTTVSVNQSVAANFRLKSEWQRLDLIVILVRTLYSRFQDEAR